MILKNLAILRTLPRIITKILVRNVKNPRNFLARKPRRQALGSDRFLSICVYCSFVWLILSQCASHMTNLRWVFSVHCPLFMNKIQTLPQKSPLIFNSNRILVKFCRIQSIYYKFYSRILTVNRLLQENAVKSLMNYTALAIISSVSSDPYKTRTENFHHISSDFLIRKMCIFLGIPCRFWTRIRMVEPEVRHVSWRISCYSKD